MCKKRPKSKRNCKLYYNWDINIYNRICGGFNVQKDLYVMRQPVVNYLSYIGELDKRVSYLESRIPEVRARLVNIMGYDPSAEGRVGSRADAIPEGVAALAELEDEWSERVRDSVREIEHVKEMCAPEFVERHILWLRVVEKKKWRDVAKAVKYTVRQAQRLEEDGIRYLYPRIPEQFRRDAFPNAAPL